jgi:uncharacterized protein YdaU (DUF1376 family)
MHYYQFNIADYRKDTIHLTPIEHYAYRQLLDQYYLSEQPISLDEDKVMRSLCVRIADDMQSVRNVLNEFFLKTENGYIHKRCDVEIEAYHAKSKSASDSAKVRWANKNKVDNKSAMRSHCDGNANHKPLTINQEPLTTDELPDKENCNIVSAKNAPKKIASKLPDDWVLPKTYGDWALQERPLMTIQMVKLEADKFKDYWISLAGVKAKKLDWFATWRNWIRNAKIENTGNPHELKQKQREEYNKNTNARLVEKILGKEKEVNHAK